MGLAVSWKVGNMGVFVPGLHLGRPHRQHTQADLFQFLQSCSTWSSYVHCDCFSSTGLHVPYGDNFSFLYHLPSSSTFVHFLYSVLISFLFLNQLCFPTASISLLTIIITSVFVLLTLAFSLPIIPVLLRPHYHPRFQWFCFCY